MTRGWCLRGVAALIFVVALFSSVSSASAKRSEDIETLLTQADRLSRAGHYREVSQVAKRLLTATERRFGSNHPNVATTLNNLGGLYRFQGRYAEAEPYCNRALAMAHPAYWSPFVGGAVNSYGCNPSMATDI